MRKLDYKGKRVAVLGAARSGCAAAQLLAKAGAQVLLSDCGDVNDEVYRSCKPLGITVEAGGHSDRVLGADLVVLSPGVPTSAPIVQAALNLGIAVCSELEVAALFCDAPTVAITGTNGKTTTTALLGSILQQAGRRAIVAGNIGTPLSSHVHKTDPETVVVLEVSSFQLDHVDRFHPQVSVLLNITPDHLDRYGGRFEAYVQSKLRIIENQTEADVLVYNYDDTVVREGVVRFTTSCAVQAFPFSTRVTLASGACVSQGMIMLHEEPLMETSDLGLRGPHNVHNSLAAALAARALDIDDVQLRTSLRSFTGVAHRLEFVRQLDGVSYINDSKATNVNALCYALESFDAPIVLLAGGRDKGNHYKDLVPLVRRKLRALIAFGESAGTVVQAFGHAVAHSESVYTLEDAVTRARACAKTGDVVLLSPACASFDLFDNYEHRGNTFRRIVKAFL